MHYYLHFAFIFRPCSPNEINLELVMQTSELYPVRRTCVVVSVSYPSPNYGVLHFWRQLHILEPGAQRARNSCIYTDVVIRVLRNQIQLTFCSSWRNVLFLRSTSLKRWRTRYLGASPCSQLWCPRRPSFILRIWTCSSVD
jgi:hypothetical protein